MHSLTSIYVVPEVSSEAVAEFLSRSGRVTDILLLQTPEQAFQQRLVTRLRAVSLSPAEAQHRLLQMETLLAFTPGVVSLLQGDEYMEERNMGAHPAALTLQESVGTLSGDVWTRQGADFGKFLALRSLLAIRSEWNLMEPHAMTRIAEEAADSLLAMALEDSPLVLLLRTAATEETWGRRGCVRSRVSVELPTTCGEETEWSLAFDSDARGLLDGTQEVMEPIPVYNCSATNKEWGKAGRVRSRERWCVNVFLGSFAVKILRREKC